VGDGTVSDYRDGRDIRAFTPVFDGLLPGHDQVGLSRVCPCYNQAALASAVSQIFILRVSGIKNKASTKHTAGTAIG